MKTFINMTSKKQYENQKSVLSFESVPNTAAGYENCRKYILANGYKYFVSAINEKDYFIHNERCNYSVWFSVDGDEITVSKANYNGRTETAARFFKKYSNVLALVHSCIKYDAIVKFI